MLRPSCLHRSIPWTHTGRNTVFLLAWVPKMDLYGHHPCISPTGRPSKTTLLPLLLTFRRSPPPLPLLPRQTLHRNPRDPRFHVDENDVEASTHDSPPLPPTGRNEPGMIPHLHKLRLRNRLNPHPDKMGKNVMVFLQNADNLGVAASPLPRLAIVVSILTLVTAELPIFPSVG